VRSAAAFTSRRVSSFYQIWPQHVNPCPLNVFRNRFSKIFHLWVIAPKPQNRTRSNRSAYFICPPSRASRGTTQKDALHSTLYVVIQGPRSFPTQFLYDIRFRSYMASNLSIFLRMKMSEMYHSVASLQTRSRAYIAECFRQFRVVKQSPFAFLGCTVGSWGPPRLLQMENACVYTEYSLSMMYEDLVSRVAAISAWPKSIINDLTVLSRIVDGLLVYSRLSSD